MPVVIQCFIVCVCKISHETNNPMLNHGYLYLEIFSRMIALTCACFSLQHVCFFFMASFLSTINQLHTHTHTNLTALFFRDYPGEPVPERQTNLDFIGARDSEWQWHQLDHMQTDNHASTPPLSFLQAGCLSCCPTNSVKALKAQLVS